MINIRKSIFETNSSSTHCIVYSRDLTIPKEVKINTKVNYSYEDFDQIAEYYKDDPDNFIAWLHRIGVERIYVDDKLIENIHELVKIPKMFNWTCEGHNDDISDEEILKYSLFGDVVKKINDYNYNKQKSAEVNRIRNSNEYVWSDWFV